MSVPKTKIKDPIRPTGVQVVVLDVPSPVSEHCRTQTPAITVNARRLSGTPTISGTRLPVAALLDYLSEGYNIRQFVKDYSEVSEEDCEAALMFLKDAVEEFGIGVEVED